jgi:phosphonate transport system substrate-binding protein
LIACSPQQEVPQLDLSDLATTEEIQAISALPQTDPQVFYFGFDLRNGPREDARQYLPLLNYLQKTTDLHFELLFSPDAKHLVNDLSSGLLQFAAIGAGSYLTASRNAPILPLVQGVNTAGETGYRAILVTAPNSPLSAIRDLKGRRVAFGSPTSTQGHWIPRIMLHQAGLTLDDLGSYQYTGSHRACAEAVIANKADACGMQDTLALQLMKAGQLRQLANSDLFPSSGIFVHSKVPLLVRQAVQQALIDFDPQGPVGVTLYNWGATEMAGGFALAAADDYTPLQAWADQLGLLTPTDVYQGLQ